MKVSANVHLKAPDGADRKGLSEEGGQRLRTYRLGQGHSSGPSDESRIGTNPPVATDDVLLRQAADEDGERGLGLQAVQAGACQLRVLPHLIHLDSSSDKMTRAAEA